MKIKTSETFNQEEQRRVRTNIRCRIQIIGENTERRHHRKIDKTISTTITTTITRITIKEPDNLQKNRQKRKEKKEKDLNLI